MTFVKFINNISSCLVPAVSRGLSKSLLTLLIPVSCVLSLPSRSWRQRCRDWVLHPPLQSYSSQRAPAWPALGSLVPVDLSKVESNRQTADNLESDEGSGGPTGVGGGEEVARCWELWAGSCLRSPRAPPGCSCSSGSTGCFSPPRHIPGPPPCLRILPHMNPPVLQINLIFLSSSCLENAFAGWLELHGD